MTSDTADGAHGDAREPGPLEMRTRSPWIARLVWLVGLVVVTAVVVHVTTHPDDLPTSETVVTASTPVDEPVFVGVFQARAGFGRTLHLSGVKVFAESTVPVTITPRLCRGGSLSVTSQPTLFCTELVDTEGSTLGEGDEVVLEVSGAEPGVVSVERVRLAFREGLQWDTQFAGSPAVVTLLSR